MSRKNPCRMLRLASPVACSAICRFARPDRAVHIQARVLSNQPHLLDLHDLIVQEEANRAIVPQRVVEQSQVDPVDGSVDQQMLHPAQVPDDADAAADNGRRERREPRFEGAHVRVERRVGETKGQLCVGSRGQGNAAGGRYREPGRGSLQLHRDHRVAHAQPARHLADALVADEEVTHAELHVVSRLVEASTAGRGEVRQPRERCLRVCQRGHRLHRHTLARHVERVRACPRDVGSTGDRPAALGGLDRIEADAGALEAQRRGRTLERLAVGDAVGDLQLAEAEWRLELAVEAELARQAAIHRVIVEQEGVAQVGDRTIGEPDSRVDLFAPVLARISQREAPLGLDYGRAAADRGVLDGDVAVLDDDVGRPIAPDDVPGAHALAAEMALHPWRAERLRHHAVELTPPPDIDSAGVGAERVHDAREQAVALEPVGAGDVERDRGVLTPGRAPLELHVRLARREAAGPDLDPLGIE